MGASRATAGAKAGWNVAGENRTARLTLLIDPRKKAIFDELCAREDVTASQKVRQFIREYIEQQLGEGEHYP